MLFSLHEIAGGRAVYDLPAFAEMSEELAEALLIESAKIAEEQIAPTNVIGDQQPPVLKDRQVLTSPGMKENQEAISENGWIGMPFSEEFGGMGLPWCITALTHELLNSANISFALSECMTQGCAEALIAHASQDLIDAYVPRLLDGTYMGSMHLTESGAGSDVGALKTKAEPKDDGTWAITGTKIFISWGDHDISDNIVQLVLARTPGSPEGTKGLSLFLVPKFLPDGARNTSYPGGLEHKLGIHGSPTCTMIHEAAVGWMVGAEHRGMAAMFTMMNNARIGVGFQGMGVSERAYQAAVTYARDRVQGGTAIINHPDVRRNLATMKALTAAARDIGYMAQVANDFAGHGSDEDGVHQRAVDLLTPIAKGFMTETAMEVTNVGIQVHGGMGVIEETGVAQYNRDCRVFAIYEGTNGIQALDLLGRKTLRDQGRSVHELLDKMRQTIGHAAAASDHVQALGTAFSKVFGDMETGLSWVLKAGADDPGLAAAGATPYLSALSYVVGGWSMLTRALVAEEKANKDPEFMAAQFAMATFYMDNLLPRASYALKTMQIGSKSVQDFDPAWL